MIKEACSLVFISMLGGAALSVLSCAPEVKSSEKHISTVDRPKGSEMAADKPKIGPSMAPEYIEMHEITTYNPCGEAKDKTCNVKISIGVIRNVYSEKNKFKAWRYSSRVAIPPIMKAISKAGTENFEMLHDARGNKAFMFKQAAIKQLPQFNDVWLYDQRSLSPTGPKPTMSYLPSYIRLADIKDTPFFVGNINNPKTVKEYSLDMQTMQGGRNLIRVRAFWTLSDNDVMEQSSSISVSGNCDVVCKILTIGYNEALQKLENEQ